MLTAEQKEIRKSGIGGSDAAALAGESRYKSPVDLYLQKWGLTEESQEESEAAYWGNVLEPVIAREFELREGKKLVIEPNLLRHEKYTWMIANIDRFIVDENAILECKTCSEYKGGEWGEEYTDQIPDEYLLQCAHYAIVTDAKYVALAVLIGGQSFKVYKYERNKELEENLIDLEHDFWHNHYLKKIPPDVKFYKDSGSLWKKSNGTSKTISTELSAHLKSFIFTRNKIKELTEQLDFDKAKLCEFLQESSTLLNEIGINIASWKTQKTSRFDVDKLKNDQPEIYCQFLKTTESRVFRIKELK